MRGKGICKLLCWNWMVLDYLIERIASDGLKFTSDWQRWFWGSIIYREGTSKLDFRKKEKKPTKQAAQKAKSNGRDKYNNVKIPLRMWQVIGSFWDVGSPLCLSNPFKIDDMCQLLIKGLEWPASRWDATYVQHKFRYCLTKEKQSLEARNAT